MKQPYDMPWSEESVHNSHFSERLTFEVSVDGSEILSLVKQVADKSKELSALSNRLIAAIRVAENDQSR